MDTIHARPHRVRSRFSPLLRQMLRQIGGVLALILGLGIPVVAFSQNVDSQDSAAVRGALEESRRLGKLSDPSYERLLQGFAQQPRIRVLVGLNTADDPLARLKGPQIRTHSTRVARRVAISQIFERLRDRPDVRSLRWASRFRDVPYAAIEVSAQELRRLAAQPEVASIRRDELMHLSLYDTVPQIGADLAWLQGYSGNGQVIAILDGGFDTGHSAFAGRIVDEACYSTTSVIENTTTLCPNGDNPLGADSQVGPGAAIYCEGMLGCDHGTHVAGIAAGDDATFRGIAPDAEILPIQVFSQLNDFFACGLSPPCLSAFTSDIIRGLERVYELKDTYNIAVVNMSLGGEAYETAAACDAAYPALKAAVDNLRSVGITVVVASGNEYHTSAIASPACLSSTVSVGAVDLIDAVADFSNSADYLDLLSPGVGIVSAVPGDLFDAKSGTSMASPGVAGTVAVLRSADPDAAPDEIVDVIKTTGVPIADWRSGLVTPRVQVDAAAELLTDGDLSRISLALVPALSGLDAPVGVTHAGDGSGRMFIMQRDGEVLIQDSGGVLATPFLDVSSKVGCCAADGLLGLAFHPDYGTNGLVFVSFLTGTGEIVVERYAVSADPDRVDPASGVEIIRIPSSADGHHGGRIHFGPDDYLYLATGDAAQDGTVPVPGPSGDPSSLLGKILRIDVDAPGVPYAVPPDNPLVGVSGALGEIWALGLRDPRRFHFDGLSGELYVADVGESERHEVDVQAADSTGGEDYGWNVMEGSACRGGQSCDPSGLVLPVAEYGFDEGCAVTGGVVYRGALYEDLYGAYLYGDLCSGRIWGLRADAGTWQDAQIAHFPAGVTAFGTDESGEVFLVDQAAGEVYRLAVSDLFIDTVRLPTAYIDVPYSETLVASGGQAPYEWSIVDGALPPGLSLDPNSGTLSGTVAAATSSVITVQIRDAAFATVTRTFRLTVTPPPLVIETTSLPDATTDIAYAASLVSSGGTPPYLWSLSAGSLPAGIALGANGQLTGTATEQGEFNFTAKVTDSLGDETTQQLTLAVFGPMLVLQVNAIESGQYGNEYGSNQHLIGLLATFTGVGTDLTLQVTGYDIDFVDELAVYLNGNLLGYLTVGPNNGLNASDIFYIPATSQAIGENRLLFRNKTSGWIWGVTDLLLSDEPAPLVVTTTALSDAPVGEVYSAVLGAQGGIAPLSWSVVAGNLPPGLVLASDGTLSGTPSQQGTFAFTARVTDNAGSFLDQALTISVVGASGTVELVLDVGAPDPGAYGNGYGTNQHEAELLATFTGTSTDLTLHVTGYDIDFVDELAVYLNGALLGYLSVGPNNGLNAGDSFFIPAPAQLPGENQLLFKNKVSGWIWGVTGLLLSDELIPLTITTTGLPDATYNAAYSQALQAEGGRTPYTWSLVSGDIPAGLALGADGVLSGTPAEQGIFDLTVRVTDDDGRFVDQAFTLLVVGASGTVEIALEVGVPDPGAYGNGYGSDEHETELFATFTGTNKDLMLHVTGYDIDYVDELAVYLNGNLLGYLSTGPNNGLNSGDSFLIPAADQLAGTNQLRFAVKTAGWIWGVTGLLLSDQQAPLLITTTALPDANISEAYSAVLEAQGGIAPYSWSLSAGSLPSGLVLGTDGILSGTPTEQGTFTFTARVTDNIGAFVEAEYTLLVAGAPGGSIELQINVTDPGAYGNGYGTDQQDTELFATFTSTGTDLTLHVTGYDIDFVDELAVYLNGNLLGYLSVGPNNGLNSGDSFFIPATSQVAGDNILLFKNKTSGWIWGVTGLLLSDLPTPLVIVTDTLPDATFGEGYTESLLAEGGHTPYVWSLVAGNLPSGLALGSDGTLSGTPTEQGIFDFTVRVTDDNGDFIDKALSMRSIGASGTIELVLEIGVTDNGQYGNKYGTNQHQKELYASFVSPGTDVTLQVTGYDIDYVDELAVYLNGNLLGYLSTGPNNGYNAGDTFAIPLGQQLAGANTLRFVVKNSAWKWGVTNLLVAP